MLHRLVTILDPVRLRRRSADVAHPPRFGALAAILILSGACARNSEDCARCDTLVIAAAGLPDALLPPLVGGSVGRDVSGLMYERLANLRSGGSPIDSSAYVHGLATRWERVDSVTLRFHLRPGAAIWLYTPMNSAGLVRRIEEMAINPYSWLAGLPEWRITPP